MTKTRSTKRALLTSGLVLIMCITMLIGTTFAWFTDSVTSANNIIKSGNLDVELYYQAEGQTDWTKVTNTTNVFKENTLWEPGHTEVVKLKVVNEGSLALKYNLGVNVASEIGSVNVNNEEFKLSDFIKFGIVDGAQTYTRDQAIAVAEANGATALKTAYNSGTTALVAKNDTDSDEKIVTMVVYMPTTVGNEANYKQGAAVPTINLGINLFATQQTAESDSFNDQYDKNAIIVTNAAEAQAALDSAEAGATIRLAPGVNYGTLVFGRNASSQVVDISNIGGDETGNERYSRYENITILGAAGATVDQITFDNGKEDANTIWNYIDVKNLTIKNVTFSGASNAVWIPDGFDIAIDGLSLVNCKMTDTEGNDRFVYQPRSGYKTLNDKTTGEYVMTSGVKNLTITGCEITGAHQVIEARAMENLTITNNTFNGIKSRDILLGRDSNRPDVYYTGTITITGNTSINGEERFVRGAGIGDANVVIKDNTILNYKGKDADYIKVTDSNGTPVIENNVVGRSVYGLTLIPNGENSKIIVNDKEGFLNLTKLSADWRELFTDGNGNEWSNYANGAGVDYYYGGRWTISLEADIDLNNATIDPVTIKHPVRAGDPTFDGNNHTIKNAKIVADAAAENMTGLFNVSHEAFKNLKLDNIHVTGSNVGNSNAGILAGYCSGRIDNITITNSSVTGGKYTGGVVGSGYTDISNCTLTNVTVKGGYKLGGIIGYICAETGYTHNVTGNTLTDCTVDGIGGGVFAGGKSEYIIGKIVGNYNCNGTCNNNTVTNMSTSVSVNIGKIEAGKTVTQ